MDKYGLTASLGGFSWCIIGSREKLCGQGCRNKNICPYFSRVMSFTIISLNAFQMIKMVNGVNFDPRRIASQIVAGIGFIGMAVIFRRGKDLEGITTAVSIWVAAAIGMAVGTKFYILAICATIITLLIQSVMRDRKSVV